MFDFIQQLTEDNERVKVGLNFRENILIQNTLDVIDGPTAAGDTHSLSYDQDK